MGERITIKKALNYLSLYDFDGIPIFLYPFVSQNEGWRTPQQLTFKQQEIVKDFSFEGVQAKRMERCYAVLNRADVLFEDSM